MRADPDDEKPSPGLDQRGVAAVARAGYPLEFRHVLRAGGVEHELEAHRIDEGDAVRRAAQHAVLLPVPGNAVPEAARPDLDHLQTRLVSVAVEVYVPSALHGLSQFDQRDVVDTRLQTEERMEHDSRDPVRPAFHLHLVVPVAPDNVRRGEDPCRSDQRALTTPAASVSAPRDHGMHIGEARAQDAVRLVGPVVPDDDGRGRRECHHHSHQYPCACDASQRDPCGSSRAVGACFREPHRHLIAFGRVLPPHAGPSTGGRSAGARRPARPPSAPLGAAGHPHGASERPGAIQSRGLWVPAR